MSEIVEALSRGPYGDPIGLAQDVRTFYEGLSEMLDQVTGITLERTGDTLVGRSIRRAYLDRAFRAAAGADTKAARRLLHEGQELLRSVPASPDTEGYRLAGDWSSFAAGRVLTKAVHAELTPRAVEVLPASESDVRRVGDGAALLTGALGELASTTLDCVAGAVLFECGTVTSVFMPTVPEISGLNRAVLGDPVALACAMYHEACHQKLQDLIATRQIIPAHHDYTRGTLITLPWGLVNGQRRDMEALRALFAFHVYVHLTSFLVEHARSTGDGYKAERLSEAWERCRFFWTLMKSGAMDGDFADDGRDLICWLNGVCERLSKAVPDDRGLYVEDALLQVRVS